MLQMPEISLNKLDANVVLRLPITLQPILIEQSLNKAFTLDESLEIQFT